jgi:outer membrane protein TolC
VADAADAYLQIRGYQARLAVALDQVSNDEHLLKLVQDRYAAGSGTGQEIAEAQASVLLRGLEKQLNRLDVLMGAQPGTYAQELGVVAAIPAIPAIPDRPSPPTCAPPPDIIAAERRLAASSDRIGVAISDYYPKVSLSARWGLTASVRPACSPKRLHRHRGGLIRWRLFDFGKVDAQVKQARGANAEALALYRQTVLRAAEDVEDSLITLSQTQDRVTEVQEQVGADQSARSGPAVLEGRFDPAHRCDQRRPAIADRPRPARQRAGRKRAAAVAVFRALGGGWQPTGLRVAAKS